MKNFALIGAGGYIAPRHMKAIKETGNNLIAALDKHDSVGILDSYFPNADFFTEFERFDRHIDMLKRKGVMIDYVSICSPNYLHDSHIRFGLRQQADVICEKPLVLNPWHLSTLSELEKETGKTIYNILQLRLHPNIVELRKKVQSDEHSKVYDIDLTYITSRGHWYYASWKGDETKSGGIAANIGIHFFDMLIWIFGGVKESVVHIRTHDRASGLLTLEKARIRWFMSINEDTLPGEAKEAGRRTFRSIKIGGEEFEFSDGFTNLHTESYQQIFIGQGFHIKDCSNAVELVHQIRLQQPQGLKGDYHPYAEKALIPHPFFK
jgi:UDP-N-acetyl-2-amino-2-deoxyglucuronate dehydrogenase